MSLLRSITRTPADVTATIARLAVGVVMFPHGAQKALGWFGGNGFAATMEFMTGQAGLPQIVALLVILGEFLGSIGLIVGCLSRLAAGGIVIIMGGAIATVHFQHGFFMNWFGQQAGEGYEYHLLMIALAMIVMIRGSGALSVDRALAGRST